MKIFQNKEKLQSNQCLAQMEDVVFVQTCDWPKHTGQNVTKIDKG